MTSPSYIEAVEKSIDGVCSKDKRIEELEAKLILAVAYIRSHIPDSIYEQRQQARAVLAKLEGQ
jgi:TATA-binding protein-associated factor Taf7